MQNLIEKMERAIEINKQDAASSGVPEIKTVARARWPMLAQFVSELRDVSAAVDAALDAKSKRVAELERDLAEIKGGEIEWGYIISFIERGAGQREKAATVSAMAKQGFRLATSVAEIDSKGDHAGTSLYFERRIKAGR